MVTILPPDTSMTFIIALLVPLIVGFLVGIVAKSLIKVGVAIAIIVIILIVIGILAPDQVLGGAVSLFKSGQSEVVKVKQIAGYLPYSSITFLIGLAIGFFKG